MIEHKVRSEGRFKIGDFSRQTQVAVIHTNKPRARRATTGALGLGGVSIGIGALAAGRGPTTGLSYGYRRVIVGAPAFGLVKPAAPPRRSRAGS